MRIVEIEISKLIDYENNPRINDGAVDAVAKSIEEFGFKVPIIVDKENVIIAGHTRKRAAEKLGLEKVPCIIADDLSEEQIKAFRLVENKTNELAQWDFDKLEEELKELQEIGIDMTAFDFESVEDIDIDSFFTDEGEKKEKKKKTITCPHCGETFEVE